MHLGALAAAGVDARALSAARRASSLAVTGTELRSPGEPLERGEIYDANGVILATQIRSTGATVERLPPVQDDAESTRAAIERGLEADVLVTSGGVSVGVHDLVRATEAELGVEEVFWRVAVRPGKPVAFGVRGRTLVFGLPGNPVSSLVGFELFVRPALLALQGLAEPRPAVPARPPRPRRCRLAGPRLAAARARTRVEDGAVVLDPLTGQESHMIAQAATADALVLVPRGDGELAPGTAGLATSACRRRGARGRRARTPTAPSASAGRARGTGPRGPRSLASGIRGVAAGGSRRELAGGGRAGEHDRERRAASRSRPRPARAGTRARRSRGRSARRARRRAIAGPDEARATNSPSRTGRARDPELGQPEPDVERREDEEQRERVAARSRAARRRAARASATV